MDSKEMFLLCALSITVNIAAISDFIFGYSLIPLILVGSLFLVVYIKFVRPHEEWYWHNPEMREWYKQFYS